MFEASFGTLARANFSETQSAATTTTYLSLGLERKQGTVTAFGANIFDEGYVNEVIPAPEFGRYFVLSARGVRLGLEGLYKSYITKK